MPNHYLVGASVTVTGTYTNVKTGALVDPSDACVDIVTPTGKLTTYRYTDVNTKVAKVSTGVYSYDIDTSALPGRWQYRWWSPPTVQTAGAGEIIIDPFPSPTP